eukprot:NODE_186_length_15678_cov_0.309262.p5 type:complete len:152 gc:universal NODE_186_length_15678_cov_0.309262:10223-10678(+)
MMTPIGCVSGTVHKPNIEKYYRDIQEASEHAHKLKICHRDVKPSNIIVVNGNAILIDLELAVSTDEDVFYDLSMTDEFAASEYLIRKWQKVCTFLYKKEYDLESLKYTIAFIKSDNWPLCDRTTKECIKEYITKRDEIVLDMKSGDLDLNR